MAKVGNFPKEKTVNTETFKMNWIAASVYCTSSYDVQRSSCCDFKNHGVHDMLRAAHLQLHTEIARCP